MTTQQQFLDLLYEIEPSDSTKDACASAHKTLRAALSADETFSKYHVSSFLSGSYRRQTAIRPQIVDGVLQRPDVDIIAVTNHTSADDPHTVIKTVKSALVDAGYENLVVNRRSIAVTLAGVDMDVVPVIEDGDAYLIPDRGLKEWVPTNPSAHTQWSGDVNASAGGRFKPLVKLLKGWRRQHLWNLRRPKGFILDCLVAEHMSYSETNYETLFVNLLETIRDTYSWYVRNSIVPFLEDPSVPGSNVFSTVTTEEFKTFFDAVEEHAALARRAKNETDSEKALALWRRVMGNRFPASATRSVAATLMRPAAGVGLSFPSKAVIPNKPAGFA
jgi:hypothetical protein